MTDRSKCYKKASTIEELEKENEMLKDMLFPNAMENRDLACAEEFYLKALHCLRLSTDEDIFQNALHEAYREATSLDNPEAEEYFSSTLSKEFGFISTLEDLTARANCVKF